MAYEPNNIQNEMAYFYAVVKNMDLNDNIKRAKICEHEARSRRVFVIVFRMYQ